MIAARLASVIRPIHIATAFIARPTNALAIIFTPIPAATVRPTNRQTDAGPIKTAPVAPTACQLGRMAMRPPARHCVLACMAADSTINIPKVPAIEVPAGDALHSCRFSWRWSIGRSAAQPAVADEVTKRAKQCDAEANRPVSVIGHGNAEPSLGQRNPG